MTSMGTRHGTKYTCKQNTYTHKNKSKQIKSKLRHQTCNSMDIFRTRQKSTWLKKYCDKLDKKQDSPQVSLTADTVLKLCFLKEQELSELKGKHSMHTRICLLPPHASYVLVLNPHPSLRHQQALGIPGNHRHCGCWWFSSSLSMLSPHMPPIATQ